jgi:hypothetical protein
MGPIPVIVAANGLQGNARVSESGDLKVEFVGVMVDREGAIAESAGVIPAAACY